MNTKINEAMQDRDYHHRKAIRLNSSFHWSKYRRLRNLVNREIKSANTNYNIASRATQSNSVYVSVRLFRKRGVRSAECGVRSAECGVRSAECGVRSAESKRKIKKKKKLSKKSK